MADPEGEMRRPPAAPHAPLSGPPMAGRTRPPEPGHGYRVSGSVAVGFDDFFLERHDAMVRALSLTLGNDELGRDAAAEGFTRALQRWNRVRAYGNPAGWVYRAGLNWALSRRRKTRRELLVGDAVADDGHAVSPAVTDPSIATALKALSVDHRAVVVGRYYLDWSERELADALDVAPGTVKSRLSRAIAQLQEHLGESTPRSAEPPNAEDDTR